MTNGFGNGIIRLWEGNNPQKGNDIMMYLVWYESKELHGVALYGVYCGKDNADAAAREIVENEIAISAWVNEEVIMDSGT